MEVTKDADLKAVGVMRTTVNRTTSVSYPSADYDTNVV
jgi:hypothetical protein